MASNELKYITKGLKDDTPIREEIFKKEVQASINRLCLESVSNTPDWILAEYLLNCLKSFNFAVNARDKWYGVNLSPGSKK